MVTRRRKLKRDSRGLFRPYIGWRIDDDGKRKQHRFNLGGDAREAELRYAAIQKLYRENIETNEQSDGDDYWSPLALSYAVELANGKRQIKLPPLDPERGYADPEAEYAQMVEVNRRFFPSLSFQPSDPHAYGESVQLNKQVIADRMKQLEAELKELGAMVGQEELPDQLITGTLHEALDGYAKMIEQDGERLPDGTLKPHQRLRLQRAERFKQHHEDIPLFQLDFDRCKQVVDHWRNRPLTKKGNQSSRDNARHHLTELYSFFKWLDSTKQFGWSIPKGVLTLSRKVKTLPQDRKKAIITKPVYSIDELAILAKHANQWERLAMTLGVNLAGGAAELGRITVGDVLLNHRHEYADRLNFVSTADDCFIRMFRRKTDVFSEHLLWPESATLVKWAIRRAEELDTKNETNDKVIFVRRSGNPLYNESSSNPQSSFANLWARLLDRTQKHEGKSFRRLPFGTLRDTLTDTLRHTHSDELASLAVAHGTPAGGDNLLNCYGNKPYGRLHEAIRELRERFLPMLTAGEANAGTGN